MARTLTVAKDFLYGGDAVPKGTKVEFLGVFHNGRKGMVKIRVSDDLPRVHNADNVFLVAPEFCDDGNNHKNDFFSNIC